ncbi:HU family DNA-binding protein [Desulfocurvibacter africanus]|uniref:HU family DNA-binding protein n=1 Tax=Desulfocurvibacter africanus TaxID=873 RepID=UPI0004196669|nr:HU family DNA-binding protein [Desulfocurvibacter africanus]
MITTQEFTSALKEKMPDLFQKDFDARDTVDIIFACIPRALKNADTVDIPGIGQISAHSEGARKQVKFKPS